MQLFGLPLSPFDLGAIAGTGAICAVLLRDIVKMDREMRSMRASFRRGAHSRQNRDGARA